MEIGGEGIENLHMNMVLKKNNSKDTFPCLFTWEWVEQIPILNCPSDDLWSLKLSYPNQHQFIGIYMNKKSYIFMLQNGAIPKQHWVWIALGDLAIVLNFHYIGML